MSDVASFITYMKTMQHIMSDLRRSAMTDFKGEANHANAADHDSQAEDINLNNIEVDATLYGFLPSDIARVQKAPKMQEVKKRQKKQKVKIQADEQATSQLPTEIITLNLFNKNELFDKNKLLMMVASKAPLHY